MRKAVLLEWLSGRLGVRSISDCVSRCGRIESSKRGLGVDLDVEFLKDGGHAVLEALTYSRTDEISRAALPGNISFSPGSDIFNGMSSLRSAAVTYFKFCEERPPTK